MHCASLWVEFWRGVPALVVLFIATIMFPLFVPEDFKIDKLVRALLAMAILMSCYLAEAVRGGLASVPLGQVEAASALGLGYWQRNFLVVMPQALSAALPQIASNLIGLTKETTVLLIIGIPDLLAMVNAAAADPAWLSEGVLMTGYVFTAAVFWVCCFALSIYARHLERRLRGHHREQRAMTLRPQARAGLLELRAYTQGKGALHGVAQPIKLSSNESSYGPSPRATRAFLDSATELHRYPDGAQLDVAPCDRRNSRAEGGPDHLRQRLRRTPRPADPRLRGAGAEIVLSDNHFMMCPIYGHTQGARMLFAPSVTIGSMSMRCWPWSRRPRAWSSWPIRTIPPAPT